MKDRSGFYEKITKLALYVYIIVGTALSVRADNCNKILKKQIILVTKADYIL